MNVMEELNCLKDVLDTLPCAIYWKDIKGTYLGCNKKQALHWGESSPDAIVGKTDSNLHFRYRLESIRETDRKVMQDKKTIVKEDVVRMPGENDQFYLTHKMPLINAEGKICGIVGMTQEVTKDRQYLKARAAQCHAHDLHSVKQGLSALQASLESLMTQTKK